MNYLAALIRRSTALPSVRMSSSSAAVTATALASCSSVCSLVMKKRILADFSGTAGKNDGQCIDAPSKQSVGQGCCTGRIADDHRNNCVAGARARIPTRLLSQASGTGHRFSAAVRPVPVLVRAAQQKRLPLRPVPLTGQRKTQSPVQ